MRLSGSIPFLVPVAGKISPADSDASLVAARAKSRPVDVMDEAAFREFYRETAPGLRAYVRRACGDAALADDLVQEAFYRFLRVNLPAGATWQTRAYLYRTASSLLADHWRRLRRERRWSLGRFFSKNEPTAEPGGDSGEAMKIFRLLKPREQELLWLAYVEGFEHREIAVALDLSEKSVRVLLFRARKKLGDALGKAGIGLSRTGL
jgi:RNA polymerase sigma-70 factor (ECF subfamily)